MNALKQSQRRSIKEFAKSQKAETLMLWFQVDPDTAYIRNIKRDRRKLDDRYAVSHDVDSFKQQASMMQAPDIHENYIVISGKHSYNSQRSNVIKKLADMGVIKPSSAMHKMVKPDLVNLIPNSRKIDSKKHIILN